MRRQVPEGILPANARIHLIQYAPRQAAPRVVLSCGKANAPAPRPKPGSSASTQRQPNSESSGSSLRQWKPVNSGEHKKQHPVPQMGLGGARY